MREFSRCVAAFAVPVALFTAGCDEVRTNLTVPASAALSFVRAEPRQIAPRFLADPFCVAEPPFFGSLGLTIAPDADLFLERVRFDFIDRFGKRALPLVTPVPSIHTTIPTSSPVPMPGVATSLIAGQVSFGRQLVPAGRRRTDFFSLQFDCGVPAFGTVFVFVETIDRLGLFDVSRTSVQIGL